MRKPCPLAKRNMWLLSQDTHRLRHDNTTVDETFDDLDGTEELAREIARKSRDGGVPA